MKSINVLIIAYKQQELIKRALNSILSQKDYGLNNIVICDDCSPDNTWNVLCEYSKNYPGIVKAYRNENNLGIYGNWNEIIKHKGSADVYYIMAGDDSLCDGIFEQVQNVIKNEHINCTESVAMYFDWKSHKPDGAEIEYRNDAILQTSDAVGLKLRNRISCRSCFVTNGLMQQYPSIKIENGLSYAETFADIQYSLLAKKNYYHSFVGSVYYSGIGVSVGLFSKEYYTASVIAIDLLIKDLPLKKKDIYWMMYLKYYYTMGFSPSFSSFLRMLYYFILGNKYCTFKQLIIYLYEMLLISKLVPQKC